MRLPVLPSRLGWLLSLLVLPLILALALLAQTGTVHAGRPLLTASIDPGGTNISPAARALDGPSNNVIVALAPLTRTTPIELVALTLDVDISESDGHTLASGSSTFKLHNSDVTTPFSATIGFPEWAGGSLSFSPDQFTRFQVTADNKKAALTIVPAPVRIGQETRTINWYSFPIDLDPDEKKLVRVDFAQDLGAGIFPRFTYGLLPSNSWKGTITSARLEVHLPAPTLGEQFIALDPSLPQFDGQNLTWVWTDFEPPADPGVTFIRPSLWNELLNRRAVVTGSPDNAGAHSALGQLYQRLASIDSPRRDNFMSQAVAEMETAARLDSKNVDAVSALAQVYETRAGPDAGPRDVSYVALALAEWQNLVGTRLDADARKHAAEDSFYLGVAARTAGQNEQAIKHFQDATNYAPQGAGPLYTREHWQTETQAAHLALARAAIDQQDIGAALDHARAAYGNGFTLDPALPFPSFALDHATVQSTDGTRKVSLHLLAYPGPSDEAKKALGQVVTALNKTRSGNAGLDDSNGDYLLVLNVPFNSDRDLLNRLHRLAGAFPQRQDWDVIRAVVDSAGIEWMESDNTLTRSVHYREDVDLQDASAALRALLNEMSQEIGRLQKAPVDDTQSQLRLALLQNAERWWQNALAAGAVRFEIQSASIPSQHWDVAIGGRATLSFDKEGIRTEVYVAGAIAAALGILVLFALLLLMRRLTRKRRPAVPGTER